jgi:tRNA pseudouridine55 synthase
MQALTIVKKRLKLQKVGFLGTLDPNADGVLVLLLGSSTKLANLMHENLKKTYVSQFEFGVETDTLDPLGKVIAEGAVPKREQIEKVLPELIGEIEIEVPKFSAVHINGKRAYDLARKGIEFTPPRKTVTIYDFKLCGENVFEITCSSGTYIRSLAKLLAQKLGTVAIAKTITRTRVGDFKIEDAQKIDEVKL